MSNFTADVLMTLQTAVETGTLDDEVEQALAIAGDLIATARRPHYRSGIPEVDAAVVSEAEGRQLEKAILDLLRQHPQSQLTCSLIWALGKTTDPVHAEEYLVHLERGVRLLVEGNRLVYQALCSLDDAGQEVFEREKGGGTSQSLTDVEKNLRQARDYLAKRGVLIPW